MKHLIIKKFFLSLILPIFLVSNFGLVTTQASTATQSSQAKKTTKAKTTAKKKAKSKAVASKNSKRNASKSQKKKTVAKHNKNKKAQSLPPVKKPTLQDLAIASDYVPSNIEADNPLLETNAQLISKRRYYFDAKKAIKQGDFETASRIRKEHLKGYPLDVYLDYYALTTPLKASNYNKVKEFIKSSDHKELSEILKKRYITFLSDEGHYSKVLGLIKQKPFDDKSELTKSQQELQCRFYEAKWRTGKADMNASVFAKKVYLQLKPYPSGCSGLIYLWGKQGNLGDNVRLEKFEKAYIMRSYTDTTATLAGTLASSPFANRVAIVMDLYDDPIKIVKQEVKNSTDDEHKAAILAYKRFANLSPKDATPYFNDFIKQYKLNETEKLEIIQIIAKGFLARSSTLEQVTWVDHNLPATLWSEDIKLMRMRRAIWFAQWQIVYDLYDHLTVQDKAEINWKYWKARAALELGKKEQAHTLMNKVAKDRSFFGFLAAQKLGKKLPFKHEHLSKTAKWPDSVKNNLAAIRFFEFHAMEDSNASIEWREVAKYGTNDEAMMMAEWALSTGHINYAIQSVIAGKRWDALDYRFPKPFLDYYQKYSKSTNVPLSFLYGISRQESMLNPVVRSPVGAVGLMQLMPNTAKMVSRKNSWPYRSERDLIDPENNIRLGSAYLREMLGKFDNNRILAAAAYNAGPGRIGIWKSKDGYTRDAAMYVENIPFTETRKYVQNVLLYDVIYKKLLTGVEDPLLKKHELAYHY